MLQLCSISRPAGGGEMVKECHMYREMLCLLDQYEKNIYSDWCNGLEQACLINLNQPLILRSSGLISVNFNPKVIGVYVPTKLKASVATAYNYPL